MILLVSLLLQQPPTLTAAGSVDLDDADRPGLAVSSTGKYVVLGEADRLRVLEAETLKPVKELPLRWTTFRFDERDDLLLVVGDGVTRVATGDWTVRVQAEIPHAHFSEAPARDGKRALRPAQALILPDLDFYYRTKDGALSFGSPEGGKVDEKPMNLKSNFPITALFGQFQNVLALAVEQNSRAAIALGGEVYSLVGCGRTRFAADLGTSAVYVGEEEEVLYGAGRWRVLRARQSEGNTCAAFDATSGWVFIGDGQGLRGWFKDRFEAPVRFDAVKGGLVQLSVDGPRRVLFALERRALRRWKIAG